MIKQLFVKNYYKIKSEDLKVFGRCYLGRRNIFGKSVTIYEGVRLYDSKIGDYSYIAHFSRVNNVDIGKFCSIGPEVLIGLGNHPVNDFVSTHPSFYSVYNASRLSFVKENLFVDKKKTRVGNDVWIGARAIIMDGISIGNGAIVAAGAIVTKDVPPYSIVAGVPAKILKFRFNEEMIIKLEKMKWWEFDNGSLKSAIDRVGNSKNFDLFFEILGE